MPHIKIPLQGKRGKGKFVLVDGDYDGEYFKEYKWALMPNGYVTRFGHRDIDVDVRGDVSGYEERFMYLHREVARPPKGYWVRFKNGNKLDCRSSNLEWITPKDACKIREENKKNKKLASTSAV